MRNKASYFLSGMLFGVLLGTVGALLFAPTTGSRTRRRIADEALRVADFARGIAERAEQTAEIFGERLDHYLGRDEEVAWRKVREIREGVERYSQAQATS